MISDKIKSMNLIQKAGCLMAAVLFSTVTPAIAGTVTANFTSASTIPVTAASYTATGNSVTITLGFAPPAGTNLTIVKNTGLGFINGQFSNLAQGQFVDLSYGGKSYRFVVNYYGGTGNDLILQWAYQDVTAWGNNYIGQLGNNSTIQSDAPVPVTQSGVLAGKTVVSVAAGGNHSLALCSDGTVAAWGFNGSGELGDNSTIDSGVPVLVTQTGVLAGKTVVSVAAGGAHSLALCSDGTVAAWGSNDSGQLGNNSTISSSVPVLVTQSGALAGKTVVSVAASSTTFGEGFSLALCSDGTVTAWGQNGSGELGNNSTIDSSVPVLVTQSGVLADKTVVSVAAGNAYSLALCSDGTVAAWGFNGSGELGDNSTIYSSVPVLVTRSGVLAAKTVVTIAAGRAHCLALCSDGTMAAWGYNFNGQLGNNSTIYSTVPILVTRSGVLAGKTLVSISAGGFLSLALCSDGTVAAWGANDSGQLGNNSTIDSSVPVLVTQTAVLAGKSVVSVAAGGVHSLALCSDGTVAAWGDNYEGELGNNSTIQGNVPGLVTQSGVLADKTVVSVSAGEFHSLALCSDGTVAAWGDNRYGNLGNNSTIDSSVPVLVTRSGVLAGKTLVSVAAGRAHSLALCSDGTVATWGGNDSGQLGNNTTIGSSLPVLVTQSGVLAGRTVVSMAAGYDHSLALCSDGTLVAWGHNSDGQLGNNSTSSSAIPVSVKQSGVLADKTVVSVSAGEFHSLALCSDGTVAAWGQNYYGQLGNNSTIDSSVPILVTQSGVLAGKTVVSVAAGGYHSLALCSDGTVAAWGANDSGQLGNNSTIQSDVPVLVLQSGVLAGKTLVSVVTGEDYSLALCSDGTVAAWGQNHYGQLGNDSTTNSSAPTFVTPSGVLAGKTVVSVAAGECHSLALAALPIADLAISITATPTPVAINGNLTYTIQVTNNGPNDASGVTVNNPLPAALAFVSATAPSGWTSSVPAVGASGQVSFNKTATLANGATAAFTIVANVMGSTANGAILINSATASTTGYDPNATNNTAYVSTPVGIIVNPTPVQLGTTATLNPQTGLFKLTVNVTNTTPTPINGFRLHVDYNAYHGPYPSLRLYNSTSPSGGPDVYVDYPYPLAVNGMVPVDLEFYTSTRTFPNPFAPTLTVETLASSAVSTTNGSGVQPRCAKLADGTVRIEFASVTGHWYRIRYSSDLVNWFDCQVPIQAGGTRMQWIDTGAPITNISPADPSVTSRFYLINEINTP